jgi:hypothetical protein
MRYSSALPGYARSCGATRAAPSHSSLKSGIGGQALDRLVPLSSKSHLSYTRGLSTRWSLWGLTRLSGGRSYLGVGFALRCFQRLSHPDMATQRCSWQNNWCTSGPSNPVLSY